MYMLEVFPFFLSSLQLFEVEFNNDSDLEMIAQRKPRVFHQLFYLSEMYSTAPRKIVCFCEIIIINRVLQP